MERRVVITGLGLVSPMGNSVNETWQNLKKGKSGIRGASVDKTNIYSQVSGEVTNFELAEVFEKSQLNKAKRMDAFVHYSYLATKEAIEHSGLLTHQPSYRTGICIGSGIGGTNVQRSNCFKYMEQGAKRVSPFYIPATIGNIAAGFISIEFNLMGPNFSVQTACATGNHAIASSYMTIKSGFADAMVVGSAECTSRCIMAFIGFDKMKALSRKYNDSPETSSRPFDKGRDGFVMSEGAATLILEDYEHAKKRNANILCEVASIGMTGDAYDIVQPRQDGESVYECMKLCLEQANISSNQLDYINAHATSTPLGDIAEAKAIKKLLGKDEGETYIGATKSMTGHALGAVASFEAIFCVKAIEENIIPANINIFELDDQIPLKNINMHHIEKDVNIALSNSFGFGGHNSSICFKSI